MNENEMIYKLRKLHADGEISDEDLARLEGAVRRDAAAHWGQASPPPDAAQTPDAGSREDLLQKLARRRDQGLLSDEEFAHMQDVIRRDAAAWRHEPTADPGPGEKAKTESKKRIAWTVTIAVGVAACAIGVSARVNRQQEMYRRLKEENRELRERVGRDDDGVRWLKTTDGKTIRIRVGQPTPPVVQRPLNIPSAPVSIDDIINMRTPEAPPSTAPPRGTGDVRKEPPVAAPAPPPSERSSKAAETKPNAAAIAPAPSVPGGTRHE
jgi:hypothetical protein